VTAIRWPGPLPDASPLGRRGRLGASQRQAGVVTSESLLGGATQLAILHDRTLYFLRQIRYGKLILTK
jgi:hemin uptake protein HemP